MGIVQDGCDMNCWVGGIVAKASRVFVRNELISLQKKLDELNNWLDDKIIKFNACNF